MQLAIEGYACLSNFGHSAQIVWESLTSLNTVHTLDKATSYPKLATGELTQFFPAATLRQLDHFSKMALLGARLALDSAQLTAEHGFGIVLTSGYGPALPTFNFLDSLIDFGEEMASPLAFSHSVHNIPASLIAQKLAIQGPSCTICQPEAAVAAGLAVAAQWLEEGRVQHVLFGAVDELTPVLAAVTEQLRAEGSASSRVKKRPVRLGEGAAFFCLAADSAQKRRATLYSLAEHDINKQLAAASFIFHSGYKDSAIVAEQTLLQAQHVYGRMPVAQAFDFAVALAALEAASIRAKPALSTNTYALCLNTESKCPCAVVLSVYALTTQIQALAKIGIL